MSNKLTDQERLEAQILSDPVYFAEMYLKSPANPKEDLFLRPYQKENEDDTTGVARGKHTMEQKIALEHYKGVIPLPLVIDRKGK